MFKNAGNRRLRVLANVSFLQRLVALFLLSVFVIGTISPAASAMTVGQSIDIKPLDPDSNKPMSQNYPGPIASTPTIDADRLAGNILNTNSVPGEALPGINSKPSSLQTGEIKDLRTAFSSFKRNNDSTITETRHFVPVHYQKDGQWQKISTELVEDKNAGDASNFLGEAYGQVKSWFTSETNFTVKDNDWQVRFGPSDFKKGMVRIRQGGDQLGFVPQGAKAGVAPVVITDEKGLQTVHYYDLWPGVNIEYQVTGGQLKENIILKDKNATNSMSFGIVGASLQPAQNGNFVSKGAFGDRFTITPINLQLNDTGLVTDTSLYKQTYKNQVLSTSIDKQYLQGLPASAFPVVVDPGIDTTTGYSGDWYRSVRHYISFCVTTHLIRRAR